NQHLWHARDYSRFRAAMQNVEDALIHHVLSHDRLNHPIGFDVRGHPQSVPKDGTRSARDDRRLKRMETVTFSISASPPFRLDLTALALQRKPVNIIDTWNGEIYSRALMIQDVPMLIQVAQSSAGRSPRLHIKAQGHRIPRDARTHITKSLEIL